MASMVIVCFEPLDFEPSLMPDIQFYADYSEKMFLLPIILEEMVKVKSWKSAEKNFASLLAENIRPVWKKTLNDLRALEAEAEGRGSAQVPKYHLLPAIIYRWSLLGTLVGVHRL